MSPLFIVPPHQIDRIACGSAHSRHAAFAARSWRPRQRRPARHRRQSWKQKARSCSNFSRRWLKTTRNLLRPSRPIRRTTSAPPRQITRRGKIPRRPLVAPSHHSNAPIKPESQSILSQIIAHLFLNRGYWGVAKQQDSKIAGIVFTEKGVDFRKWPTKPYVPTGIKRKK
jgi:hypothetical protein